MKMQTNIVLSIVVISITIIILYIYREPFGTFVNNSYNIPNDTTQFYKQHDFEISETKLKKKDLKDLPYNFLEQFKESKDYHIYKSIAKNGHSIPETKTEIPFMYYFPETIIEKNKETETEKMFKWTIKNGWLIKDILNDKYYSPEGLIQIDKDFLFEWEPLCNISDSEQLEFFIIHRKNKT